MHRLLVVLVLLVGCNSVTLVTVGPVEPPTRVEARIDVASDHPTDPLRVDFGQVDAGDVRTKELTIRNLGTDALQVQDLVLPGVGGFSVVDGGDAVLAPDAATVVTLAYAPARDESLTATMQVLSNDRDQPAVAVTLVAEGLAPAVALDPPGFDFGAAGIGCVRTLDLTLSNVGRAALTIESVGYEDLAAGGELTLLSAVEAGAVLDPGDSPPLQVIYTPTDVLPDAGHVVVRSNDPESPEARASQQGNGAAGESRRDEYLQEGNNATDILFVVDDSCSMDVEQTSLATNFSSFLQIVDALEIDYRLGVVSTDVGGQGHLQGVVRWISPTTPDPAGTWSANVNLGVNGSAVEQGLHTSWLALTAPNTDPGGANDGFLREHAGLRVVYVSDENDQSSSILGWGPMDYVLALQSLKANPDHVVLSDITGNLSGCSGAGGSASTGSEYVQATVATGGVSASICDPNWIATLSSLAWISVSYADTFELSEVPVEDSLEVRLNTVPVFVGWVYDAALNAVVFDAEHVPENGDLVEIEYAVMPACAD